jgi:hypothetical protein
MNAIAGTDSPLQQVLRSSQRARALGRYNEANIILDDYFTQNAGERAGIAASNEFALNYLAQGYLKRAFEVIDNGANENPDLLRDSQDPELALFDLLVAVVQLRYANPEMISICEVECLRVWKGHLEVLMPGGHTETHVKLPDYLKRWKLTVFSPLAGQT